jgi:hypothetical protein
MRTRTAAFLLLASLSGPAGAKTVYVANDGLDGAACGAKTAACRSITQGIAHAAAGDTVLVGPGRYGDLDADGTLGEPGEEAGAAAVVDVDKAVRVYSSDGADATAILATGLAVSETYVRLTADDAAFGRLNGGFTIVGEGQATGLTAIGAGVSVVGNVALVLDDGFTINGENATVTDNRASACGTGFEIYGAGCVAARNVAIGNTGIGIRVEGVGCTLDANVTVANGTGINGDSTDVTIRRSLVAGNVESGASLVGSGYDVEASSFFGNGDGLPLNPNCAILGETTIDATGNYWGSPLGPGHDPADLVCSEDIVFEPFAKKGKTPKLKPTR